MDQTILVVEDDRDLREAVADTLALEGYRILQAADGKEALSLLHHEAVSLVVSDVNMKEMDGLALLAAIRQKQPALPVLLMTAYGSIPKAVEAMRDGAVDYLSKPFEASVLVDTVQRHIPSVADDLGEPVCEDPRSRELLAMAERVAQTDATVILNGESGTGKEVMARFIHRHSQRAEGPFIAINCAAIPESMLEATLFGYEKGAFTGAHKAVAGKFEMAQGGTLLLDEISEMELGLQAKLLRVLQEREVERLGGGKAIALDVRVVATTNRDMKLEVREGRFREDLFYRLNVFPLSLPPLRDRPGDILPLAERSLNRAAGATRHAPTLSSAAAARLVSYDWPGNIRELDNVMQRALILQPGNVIAPADLHLEESMADFGPDMEIDGDNLDDELRSREYGLIMEALKDRSRKAAAEKLGISERTLRYKLARMREAGLLVPEKVA